MDVHRNALIVLVLAIALTACTGPAHEACRVPAEHITTVVHWHGQPLRVPFAADDRALLVEQGSGPSGVSRQRALEIAHGLLLDAPTGTRTVPGCDGCTTTAARIRSVVAGRVTVSAATRSGDGEPHSISHRPAWVVAYVSPSGLSCPFEAGPPPQPARDASNLHALIIASADPGKVVAYDGAGTGWCWPRLRPEVTSKVSAAVDLGEPG